MSSKDKGHIVWLAFRMVLILTHVSLTSGQFYPLEDALRNYSEAVLKCRSLGHDGLAVVDSKEKLQTVLNTIHYKTEDYWIGMHYSDNKKHHVWDTGANVTWADWYSGEQNFMPTDKCVRIKSELRFATMNCSVKFMAVCGNFSTIFHDMTVSKGQQVSCTHSLWSGKATSLLACVTRCTNDPQCQHSLYNSSNRACVTLSKSYDVAGSDKRMLYGSLASRVDVTLV